MGNLNINRSKEVTLLYVILVFSVIFLLLIAGLVSLKFSRTAYSFKKIHEGHLVINYLHDVQTELSSTGYSVRYFLITRDAPAYTKLPEIKQQLMEKVTEIDGLMSVYPDQKVYVDSLRANLEARFKNWDLMINVSPDSLKAIDNLVVLKNTGLMRSILNECNELRNHENMIIDSNVHDTEDGSRWASFLALGSTLLCVSVIIFALYKLNGEVKHGMVMQTELKRKIEELDRSNADLERFAYIASHDLHAPLRKLYAFSEILVEREQNLSEEGLDIIKRMHTFVTRMQGLIDDMLAFSLNFNKIEKSDIDLNQLVKNANVNLAVNISESNATIEAGLLPAHFSGYESQLNQLFQNIISNSIKYSREGVPPYISIRAMTVTGAEIPGAHAEDAKKKFHKISFADNGIGFDNKYKDKIFVIFQRLHGKSEYSGTGIGLATVKRVIDNHNGYITADGKENGGAEFIVYLPVG